MAMGRLTTVVLVDANVFLSLTLRNWLGLCYLERDGWFEVTWTEDIMAEVIYHLRKMKPTASERQIGGVRDRLVGTFSTGRIAGYAIDADLPYPDIFDAHVHAAAIHADVDFVLTADKGFDQLQAKLDDLPYEVHSPDSFFCLIDDSSPDAISAVTQKQLDYWKAKNVQFNLCTQLRDAGAPQFAERVRSHLQNCSLGGETPAGPRDPIDISWSALRRAWPSR